MIDALSDGNANGSLGGLGLNSTENGDGAEEHPNDDDTEPGTTAQRHAGDVPATEILAPRGSVDATSPPEDGD